MITLVSDFARFVTAQNPNYRCPVCGDQAFPMNVQATALVADLAVAVQPPPALPIAGLGTAAPLTHGFYTRSCARCGYTEWQPSVCYSETWRFE
jgi:ribosomal protein S27AE